MITPGRHSIFSPSVEGESQEAQQVEQRLDATYQHWSSTETYQQASLEREFTQLAAWWKAETEDESAIQRIAMHPAYQRIIGLGRPALPWILADLEETHDSWFWALWAITGEDPVPEEDKGYLDRMVRSWVRWGMQRGII